MNGESPCSHPGTKKRPRLSSWSFFVEIGAGDGNRTHVVGLEGRSITIMLHPHSQGNAAYYTRAQTVFQCHTPKNGSSRALQSKQVAMCSCTSTNQHKLILLNAGNKKPVRRNVAFPKTGIHCQLGRDPVFPRAKFPRWQAPSEPPLDPADLYHASACACSPFGIAWFAESHNSLLQILH